VELAGGDLSDDLVSELMSNIALHKVNDGDGGEAFHHVSFRIRNIHSDDNDSATNDVITCRVASVHNEVGMKLWEAGFFLAEYALSHPELFQGKNVVEIGAGTGFTGLVLATMPAHVAPTSVLMIPWHSIGQSYCMQSQLQIMVTPKMRMIQRG
jgi:hypothetical protein